MERRKFLRLIGQAWTMARLGGGALPLGLPACQQQMPQAVDPAALVKFVDPLPIPSVLRPSASLLGVPLYEVTMQEFQQQLHSDLPPTILWGYNGMYPGPTFEVRRGQPIAVQWMSALPAQHLLQVDPTLVGCAAPAPEVRSVVHLHGAKVLPDSDGYPEAWFTPNFAQTGPMFSTKIYRYPNDQPAAQLWYHDQAIGLGRLNVCAGLAGCYFIRDPVEDGLKLPSGDYEIPLLIADRTFDADGNLLYPAFIPGGDKDPRVPPVWIPEFYGDTILVNGKVWPYLQVEPRKYRFRMLNGANARFFNLTLNESSVDGVSTGGAGPAFTQIGSDGGLLPAPLQLAALTMSPAERFDVIIDFSGTEGKYFVLNNDAKAPYPAGSQVVPTTVMLFMVTKPLMGTDATVIAPALTQVPQLSAAAAVATRDLVIRELQSAAPFGNSIFELINGHWDDPVTETPKAGTVEIWRIINSTAVAQPLHVHLVQFQILDRQPFDLTQYPGKLVLTGPAVLPAPSERSAVKDTVTAPPGQITRIIAKFDLPTGTAILPGQTFRYVLQGQILEHADNEMLRPYDVIGG